MKSLALLISLIFITSCTYRSLSIQNTVDLSKTNILNVVNSQPTEVCASYVLFFGPFGSNHIGDAVKQGKIKKIALIETVFRNYFLFQQFCTLVYAKGGKKKKKSKA